MAKILRLLSLFILTAFALSACASGNSGTQATDDTVMAQPTVSNDAEPAVAEAVSQTQNVTFYDSFATW